MKINGIHAAMWADRVATKRTTGYSPYYLLYRTPHLFPYSITDHTWYTIDWHKIQSTKDLIAMRAKRIKGMNLGRSKAAKSNLRARIRAAEDYAKRNKHRLVTGIYRVGKMVLVSQNELTLDRTYVGTKAADRWAGPFRIKSRNLSES